MRDATAPTPRSDASVSSSGGSYATTPISPVAPEYLCLRPLPQELQAAYIPRRLCRNPGIVGCDYWHSCPSFTAASMGCRTQRAPISLLQPWDVAVEYLTGPILRNESSYIYSGGVRENDRGGPGGSIKGVKRVSPSREHPRVQCSFLTTLSFVIWQAVTSWMNMWMSPSVPVWSWCAEVMALCSR